MPGSYDYFYKDIEKYLTEKYGPKNTILDVGPGWGTYSNILKEHIPQIDCVEVFEKYIVDYDL